MTRWLREPLVHFVAAGAILFGALALFRDDAQSIEDGRTIVVDRRSLLSFLQYRANAFEAGTFGAALDAMTDAEIQEVIDAYIDEEILYREALDAIPVLDALAESARSAQPVDVPR